MTPQAINRWDMRKRLEIQEAQLIPSSQHQERQELIVLLPFLHLSHLVEFLQVHLNEPSCLGAAVFYFKKNIDI